MSTKENVVQINDSEVRKVILKAVKGMKTGLSSMFSNKITMEDMAQIKKLDFRRISMMNLDFLKYCPNLEELVLSHVSGLSNIEGISYCSYLKCLDVYNTNITDFDPLLNCKELELFIYDCDEGDESCRRSDFNFLKAFPVLKDIELVGNWVEDVSFLAECSAMEKLILDLNPITTISSLKNAPGLVRLEVQECKLQALEDIEHFPKLQELYARCNAFGQEEIAVYREKYKHLNVLELDEEEEV